METVRRRKATMGEATNSGKSGSDAPCYRAVCPSPSANMRSPDTYLLRKGSGGVGHGGETENVACHSFPSRWTRR